jgi:hypothetical protein
MQTDLETIISRFSADTGTTHLVEDRILILKAHMGVPAQVLQIIRKIPIGKGMAGVAVERNEPVLSCNIQVDRTGDVRSGATLTGVRGAVVAQFATEKATRWAPWESASIESMPGATPRSRGCSRRPGSWPRGFPR